jgi:hypothetical protein
LPSLSPKKVIRPVADGTPYGPPHDAVLALPTATSSTGTTTAAAPPRLYIMTLPARAPHPLAFDRITFHGRVSQCLAALDGAWAAWYLAVAAPTGSVEVRKEWQWRRAAGRVSVEKGKKTTQPPRPRARALPSPSFFFPLSLSPAPPSPPALQRFPAAADIVAFRIPPGVFVKLHPGTWHAGPLFEPGACVRRRRAEGGGGREAAPPTMAFANLEMADTNVTDHNTHVYGERGGFVVVPPAEEGAAGG